MESLHVRDFARRARRLLAASALALACLLPSTHAAAFTNADCVLQITPAGPATGNPGDFVQFNISVSEQTVGGDSCSVAEVNIVETSDSTSGSTLNPPTFTGIMISNGGTPHTATIELPVAPNGGGSVTFQAQCVNGCQNAAPFSPTFTVNVNDVYQIGFNDPSTGTAFVNGGEVRSISVVVNKNGAPLSGSEGQVCFDFSSNPNNATLSGGLGACGSGGQLADPAGGVAAVQLNAADAMPDGSSTVVAVTGVGFTDAVSLTFQGSDFLAHDAQSGDNQIAAANTPFAEPLVAFAYASPGGAPLANRGVVWSIDAGAPAGTQFADGPGPVARTTDANGLSSVTLIAGSGPGSITVRATLNDNPDGVASFGNLCVDDACGPFFYQIFHDTPADGNASNTVNVPIPLAVRVTVDGNTPAENQPVEFTVVSESPAVSFSPSFATSTDASGIASVQMTAGSEGLYTVRATAVPPAARSKASVGGLPVFVDFLVAVEKVRTIELPADSNDGFAGQAGESVVLKITARDDGFFAAPSSPIKWQVLSGDASLAAGITATDSTSGTATNTLTFGPTPGAVVVRAWRNGVIDPSSEVAEVFFTLENFDVSLTHPSPADATPSGLVGQSIPLNALLQRIGTSVTPIVGEQVHYSIQSGPAGHGAILDPGENGTTGADGVASVGLLADLPGTYGVQAEYPAPVPVGAKGFVGTRTLSYTVTVAAVAVNRTLVATSGDGQSALAGDPLPQPLQVQAADDGSAPASPVGITWSVSPVGAATFAPDPSSTDANGFSSVNVTISPSAAPGPITITATRADDTSVSTSFTATVQAPVVRTLVKPATASGDGQSGRFGTTLPLPLRALAEDSGSPASGVQVNWVVSGDATLSASLTSTGTDGLTQVTVTLGNTAQSITITASRQDAPAATTSYVVTAQADPVESLVAIGGDNQVGLVNSAGDPLQVQYTIDGVVQSGVQVGWQVESGSATLSSAFTTTDASGNSEVGITFGSSPGPITVLATAGNAAVRFELSAANAMIAVQSGSGQSGAVGSTLPNDFVGRVSLPNGALAGVDVTWEVVSGGGSITPTTTVSNAQGLVATRLTLGPQAGENVVRATVAGGNSVEFRAVGVGPSLRVVTGSGQRGPMQTQGQQPLVVELRDAGGNPLSGRTITWSTINGPATPDATSSVTDATGRAQVGFRYGDTPGIAGIRASSADAGAVDFVVESVQATLIGAVRGNNQTGATGQELAEDFVVAIAPVPGKSLAGVTVFWEVIAGGGTLRNATSVTDASGEARNRLTLGPQPGLNQVRASIPGDGEVVFSAEGVVRSGQLRVVSGSGQTLPTNDPSQPLVVELIGSNGTPIAGATIRWSAVDSTTGSVDRPNARVDNETTTTDAQGRTSNVARVLLPGPARIRAEAVGIEAAAVEFALNGGVANIPTLNDEQERTSRAIDNACPALAALPNRSPAQEDLYQRCLELIDNAGDNPDEVEDALDQIPTQLGDSLVDAGFQSLGTQFGNHSTRFEALRKQHAGGSNQFNIALWTPTGVMPLSFLPSALVQDDTSEPSGEIGGEFERWGFFATGTLGRGKSDGEGGRGGYDFDTAGLTAGVDYRFSDQLVGGVSLGYANHDSDLRGGLGALETRGWTVSGYATWFNQSNWYLDGVLSYGNNDYKLDRRLAYSITALDGSRTVIDQRARADTDGSLLGTAVSFGRDFQKGPWNFSSYLRGNYSRVDLDGYEERMLEGRPGAGLALRYDARTLNSLTSALGGKATYIMSRDWGVLMPHLQVEWEHEFRDDAAQLIATFVHDPTRTQMEQRGSAVDTDYYNVGIGLSALFPGGRSAYLYYEQLLGASRLSQGTLSIGARFEF